jgi:CRISPR/Cas system-associated protein Csx1
MIEKFNKEKITEKERITTERIKERLENDRLRADIITEKAKRDAKKFGREFNKEFKKEMRTAIIAAFGLLIALVWKDVITNFVNSLSEKSPFSGAFISALGVTVICVLGIMLSSRLLKEKDEDKKEQTK